MAVRCPRLTRGYSGPRPVVALTPAAQVLLSCNVAAADAPMR